MKRLVVSLLMVAVWALPVWGQSSRSSQSQDFGNMTVGIVRRVMDHEDSNQCLMDPDGTLESGCGDDWVTPPAWADDTRNPPPDWCWTDNPSGVPGSSCESIGSSGGDTEDATQYIDVRAEAARTGSYGLYAYASGFGSGGERGARMTRNFEKLTHARYECWFRYPEVPEFENTSSWVGPMGIKINTDKQVGGLQWRVDLGSEDAPYLQFNERAITGGSGTYYNPNTGVSKFYMPANEWFMLAITNRISDNDGITQVHLRRCETCEEELYFQAFGTSGGFGAWDTQAAGADENPGEMKFTAGLYGAGLVGGELTLHMDDCRVIEYPYRQDRPTQTWTHYFDSSDILGDGTTCTPTASATIAGAGTPVMATHTCTAASGELHGNMQMPRGWYHDGAPNLNFYVEAVAVTGAESGNTLVLDFDAFCEDGTAIDSGDWSGTTKTATVTLGTQYSVKSAVASGVDPDIGGSCFQGRRVYWKATVNASSTATLADVRIFGVGMRYTRFRDGDK